MPARLADDLQDAGVNLVQKPGPRSRQFHENHIFHWFAITFLSVAAAMLIGGAFNVASAQDDACPDLYLVNGRFFSMAELPRSTDGVAESDFNSMRIAGNAIAEVGDDLMPPDCATTVDLDGNTVIPGLSDTHMHFIRATLRPGIRHA